MKSWLKSVMCNLLNFPAPKRNFFTLSVWIRKKYLKKFEYQHKYFVNLKNIHNCISWWKHRLCEGFFSLFHDDLCFFSFFSSYSFFIDLRRYPQGFWNPCRFHVRLIYFGAWKTENLGVEINLHAERKYCLSFYASSSTFLFVYFLTLF